MQVSFGNSKAVACNNYAMKKAAIKAMLRDEGRNESEIYVAQLAKDTALYPVSLEDDNLDWGITMYVDRNDSVYILDYTDQHP